MKERRSLVDGLKTDPETQQREEEFVFGSQRKADAPSAPLAKADAIATPIAAPASRILPQMTGRIPVTTRCRPEVATALKRASLQRQLAGVEPFYVQDIMEEALENWLRDQGYV